MVSVCMATRNGERFLAQQISSILLQLTDNDELVIVDDHSTDASAEIINSFKDKRIRFASNPVAQGVGSSFERSLTLSRGENIFLSDQDDVWMPKKIATQCEYLSRYDLVVTDCIVTDELLRPGKETFFQINNSGAGFLRNLFSNSYMGCCMAFRRRVLERALPFPGDLLHDSWIGMVAEKHFSVFFLAEPLIYHRRHRANASSTAGASRIGFYGRLQYRYNLMKSLMFR